MAVDYELRILCSTLWQPVVRDSNFGVERRQSGGGVGSPNSRSEVKSITPCFGKGQSGLNRT